jgi:uncharacterized protein (TIGR00369 family)
MSRLQDVISGWLAGETEPPPVAKLVGMRLIECENGTAQMELNTGERHYNPMGSVHGGILCDLADAAMGVALASTLEEGQSFTTIELGIHYLRPVYETHLTATAKTVHRGRSMGYVECEIVDERGRLIAKATSTCMIR